MMVLRCHESCYGATASSVIYSVTILGSFAMRRSGTILCGSNTTTEDFARWVLGTAETQPRGARRAPSNDPLE
jgi:hypothetical protein